MTNLIGLTQDQLYEVVRELGEAKFRGKQIYEWVYKHRTPSIDHMTNLPKDTREKLKEKYTIEHIKIEKILIDEKDETHKFLFSLNDQNTIEGVLMKYKYGYALCVSTQVGCKMGCTFCASTLEGIVRSLTSGEIIDQIMVVENHFQIRISNVVLMGSGEPLDNYDEVLKFIYNVNNSNGINIGQRHLSLSTCGIVPKIYDLAKENLQMRHCLSYNPYDEHGEHGFFPHAAANVETRGEAVFAARNAIDGIFENTAHGAYPYQSWGINRDPNAQLTIDFGRKVTADEVRLTLRADFPHDNYWETAVLAFDDGSEEMLSLRKTGETQVFTLQPRTICKVTLRKLRMAEGESPFPALTQIELYGTEAEQ
mgnify:CR=1 FL=1